MMMYWLLLCSTYMFYSVAEESTVNQGLINKQFTTSTNASTAKNSDKPKNSTHNVTSTTTSSAVDNKHDRTSTTSNQSLHVKLDVTLTTSSPSIDHKYDVTPTTSSPSNDSKHDVSPVAEVTSSPTVDNRNDVTPTTSSPSVDNKHDVTLVAEVTSSPTVDNRNDITPTTSSSSIDNKHDVTLVAEVTSNPSSVDNKTAPPAPVDLVIYSKTKRCAFLRWKNPVIPYNTGTVEHYIEYSKGSATIECSNSSIRNCDKWNGYENYFCGSCCYLTTKMNYTFMVRATYKGADKLGNFSEARSTILMEELPEPPRNLTVSWSGFNLTLMWEHPLFPNGRIVAFRIYINSDNISYANSQHTIPWKNYAYTIDATKYKSETLNISVCAANSAGRSTNVSITTLTIPGRRTRIINSTIPANMSDITNLRKDNEPNKPEFTIPLAVLMCFLLVGCILAAIRFYYVKTKPKIKCESPKEQIVTAHLSITTAPTFSHIVSREDFKSYITQEEELQNQFQTMNALSIKLQTVGKMQENKLKNRYQNIIPYDDMRVILNQIDGDEYSDYINASYIRGYNAERRYIAAQGPLTTTLNDFWRMIWQENVECIVMLANLTEDGKKKCELYWPSLGDAKSFNDIEVLTLQDVTVKEYIQKRTFQVESSGQSRMVTHIHFTEWPDHGVPDSPLELAELITEVRNCNIENTPIVVHCSAGIGRTGTFILCDIALDMVKETGKIDACKIFYELRQQRCFMVQMRDQYLYAHNVILELLEKDK